VRTNSKLPDSLELDCSRANGMVKPTGTFRQPACTPGDAWRCPSCLAVLGESSENESLDLSLRPSFHESLHCDACQKQFDSLDGIPIFSDSPSLSTQSLTQGEVTDLLKTIASVGWSCGLRTTLMRLPPAKARAALAELCDPRAVVNATLVGKAHFTSVLCLGFSAGGILSTLAGWFPQITVCDQSLGRLRILKTRSECDVQTIMRFACLGDADHLPLPPNSFDLVLVDMSMLAEDGWPITSLCTEVGRVLRAGGSCLIGARNKWFPSWLSHDAEAKLPGASTPTALRSALDRAGLECRAGYGLLPDNRSPEVVFDLNSRQLSRTLNTVPGVRERLKSICFHNDTLAPTFAVVADRPTSAEDVRNGPTFLQGVLKAAEENLCGTLQPKRIIIRKSGRVVVLAALNTANLARGVVVKLPNNSWLYENEERNTDALQAIHASQDIPLEVKNLVPRHLARGEFGGQAYFVEEQLHGRTTRDSKPTIQFAAALLRLHEVSKRPVTFGDSEVSVLRSALERIRPAADGVKYERDWQAVGYFLEKELVGRTLHYVWSHGDAGSNFLRNGRGQLSGIMDWETFDRNGLPLYDWILLSVARNEGRWDSLQLALDGDITRFFGILPIDEYLRRLDVERSLVPSLVLSAWVHYVSHRFQKRSCDPFWLRRTVLNVLDNCRGTLAPFQRAAVKSDR
jgi:SAM-dependent methyltransferase